MGIGWSRGGRRPGNINDSGANLTNGQVPVKTSSRAEIVTNGASFCGVPEICLRRSFAGRQCKAFHKRSKSRSFDRCLGLLDCSVQFPRRETMAFREPADGITARQTLAFGQTIERLEPVSYTHLRAHETRHDLVCRLL